MMGATNFVWLTFDSVRGDRTSIGGYDRETTPTLERIGRRDDGYAGSCFSHALWSQPSVASMMTGTYPSMHGLGSRNEVLPDSIPTVAERLSEAGFETIGVSANPFFSESTGTHRGFDRFDFVNGTELAREAGVRGSLSFVRNLRTFSGGFTLERQRHNPDYLLNEIVKDRLQDGAEGDDPFFLAAHYYGLHHPYFPSPKYRETFADDLPMSADEAAELALSNSRDVYERIAEGPIDDPEAATALDNMYDAQVAQVDALVAGLLSYVDNLGLGDDTIVVITADHGDLLGELGLYSHKLVLHDALVQVPLAVRGSEAVVDAAMANAQHADVMQMILSELDVDTDGMHGAELTEGPRETVVAQRGDETREKTLSAVREFEPDYEHEHVLAGMVTMLRTDEWKFVTGTDGSMLYRLPDESEDVSDDYPGVVERFETTFDVWMDEHGQPLDSGDHREFDDDVKSQLADLGYVVE
ncbi:sulfatase [Haloarcula sp. H-GB5]